MNPIKASRSAVERNDLYRNLISALGAGWDENLDLKRLRYERVILLFDPDADGIHCGALASMFFYRWMRPMLEQGYLSVVRPPLYEVKSTKTDEVLHAYSENQYQKLRDELDRKGIAFEGKRYRGLASMSEMTLFETCIDSETRNLSRLEIDDAEAVVRVFGGNTSVL